MIHFALFYFSIVDNANITEMVKFIVEGKDVGLLLYTHSFRKKYNTEKSNSHCTNNQLLKSLLSQQTRKNSTKKYIEC